MKKLIASAVLAALAIGGTALAAESAHAGTTGTVRLEKPVRHVQHVRVTYVHKSKSGPKWVEFNTGSLWSVVACKTDDSRNCYWDASKRGNGKGRDFVNLNGKTFYPKGI